jgi:hypothetical protein
LKSSQIFSGLFLPFHGLRAEKSTEYPTFLAARSVRATGEMPVESAQDGVAVKLTQGARSDLD